MSIVNEINELPDFMDKNEIKVWFHRLFEFDLSNPDYDKKVIAEGISELSDRQWHTYELLDYSTMSIVENWIEKNWSSYDLDYIVEIAGIIGTLGLSQSYNKLNSLLDDKSINDVVKAKIIEITTSFGNSVEDPYSTLR